MQKSLSTQIYCLCILQARDQEAFPVVSVSMLSLGVVVLILQQNPCLQSETISW